METLTGMGGKAYCMLDSGNHTFAADYCWCLPEEGVSGSKG